MKANLSAHQNWKQHCVDAALITMVVGSLVGLAIVFLHQ
jgi:hypothetical protein